MKIIGWMVALMLVMPGAEAGQLYKCSVQGNVTYQGTPCTEGQEKVMKAAPSADPVAAQELRERLYRETEIRHSIKRDEAQAGVKAAREKLRAAQQGAMDLTGTDNPAEAMRQIKVEKCKSLADLLRFAESDYAQARTALSGRSMEAARREFAANGCGR